MSREIKFRAWGKNMNAFIVDDKGNRTFGIKGLGTFEDLSVWEFMQYTGLHDRNGVEIYEGDLLRNEGTKPWSGRDFGELVKVVWDDEYAGYNLLKLSGYGDANEVKVGESWGINNAKYYFEVIGNIYESPELLEGK